MTRKKGTMSFSDFKLICDNLSIFLNNPKKKIISTNGFGEPLIDKNLYKKIKYLQNFDNIYTRILTTGIGLNKDIAEKLISSRLSEVIFSFYGTNPNSYKIIHGSDYFKEALDNILMFAELNNSSGNDVRVMVESINFDNLTPENNNHEISYLKTLMESKNIILNDNKSLLKWWDIKEHMQTDFNCPVINGFRKSILQVTWEGDLIPCCNDYNATIKFGNLKNNSIEEIISNEKYNSFKTAMLNKNYYKYQICKICSNL